MIPRHRPAHRARSCIVGSVLLVALATTSVAERAQPAAPIDEITVVGERPGPGLWKATRDGHTLWLMGLLDPLPKRMTWRSAQVERVIAGTQLVQPAGTSVKADAGPIALVGLYFRVRRAQRLPDGQTLAAVLPSAQYNRLQVLRRKYAPGLQVDGLRPIVAAQRLYEEALSASGLRGDRDVEKSVLHLARAHGVPVEENVLRLEDPKGLLDDLDHIPQEAELRCLDVTLTRIESDLPALRERATAWAVGDVAALRRLRQSEQRSACWEAVGLSPRLRALIDAQRARRVQRLDAARVTHASTLALLPVDQLLAPDGVLETLRRMGYEVEEP
ncbi:MAG: hypothetical protein RL684_1709 [Pseudomonadota bacterium]